MYRLINIIFFLTLALISTASVNAQEKAINGLIVTPGIIDEKVKAKEIFDYEVKLKNISEKKVDIYAVVDDISDSGQLIEYNGPGSTDRTVSLSSWILFKRGVIEINPGEEMTVPLKIQVSDYAVPGKRYAQIVFPYGSNRQQAKEKTRSQNFAKIMINMSVEEEIIEKAQIKEFKALKKIFLKESGGFKLIINNFGNKAIVPVGEIYIYDRRNKEIINLDANPEKKSIASGEEQNLDPSWSDNLDFGKYKAKLELEYGDNEIRDMQDTVFFWVMPLKILIIIGVSLFVFLVISVFILFRKTYKHHHLMPQIEEAQKEEEGHVIDLKND